MPDFIQIHPSDNVAVALKTLPVGAVFEGVTALQDIPQGHKMALAAMEPGQQVVKYGFSIGHAIETIAPGDWVHTHNMKTNLSGEEEYNYHPNIQFPEPQTPYSFMGYRRKNGYVGSETRFGSSPPWAVSTMWQKRWWRQTRIW